MGRELFEKQKVPPPFRLTQERVRGDLFFSEDSCLLPGEQKIPSLRSRFSPLLESTAVILNVHFEGSHCNRAADPRFTPEPSLFLRASPFLSAAIDR